MNVKLIASIISQIENNSPNKKSILSDIYGQTGKAHRIGITGPPGSGKSSLINQITSKIRSQKKTVAIICVDPTSPFSGGAILGDRIRMLKHHSDEGVFIRSMANRSALGGLALTSSEVGDVLDSHGFDFIIFETLGVGQVEIDVINETDTVAVVLVPESGDDIQMMKAGLIEIADLYIINKSDRQGADTLELSLKNMLEIDPRSSSKEWNIPILKTNALSGEGVNKFINSMENHFNYLNSNDLIINKINNRYQRQVKFLARNKCEAELWKDESKVELLKNEISKAIENRKSPYELIDIIIKDK